MEITHGYKPQKKQEMSACDSIIRSEQRTYKIFIPPIVKTNASVIYRAEAVVKGDKEDHSMSYVVKRYIKDDIPDAVEREQRNSLKIHNKLQNRDAVIPITAIDEENNYAIMEFKGHGKFLNELILELEAKSYFGRDKISVQLEILKEILISLEAIHSCADEREQTSGYVHLDLHPGNIFFESTDIGRGQAGNVKFIDFLSARPLDGDRVSLGSLNNEVIASPVFAAPEYAEGCLSSVCRATDLYSVGKIFCRMLLGGIMNTWEEDSLKYNTDSVRRAVGNRLKAYILTPFIQCALDVEPKYRFRTAREMLKALERMQAVLGDCNAHNYYVILDYLYDTQILTDEAVLDGLEFKPGQFEASVKELAGKIQSDSFEPSKCHFIFCALRHFLCNYEGKSVICASVRNLLLESGVACCNYTGKTKEAYELYEQLLNKYKSDLSGFELWRYWGLINRVAVIYADSFQYEKAFDVICDNIIRMKKQKKCEARKITEELNLEGDYVFRKKELARAYSGAGCYLSLKNHKMPCDQKTADRDGNTPMDYFTYALEEFGAEDSDNCQITVSHILHYAVEIEDQELFEKYALKWHYFGSEDEYGESVPLSESLKYLLAKEYDAAYPLYIFLKGVHTFYMKKLDVSFIENLRAALRDNLQKSKKYHPMELVFRYVALILSEAGTKSDGVHMNQDVEYAFSLAMTFVPETRINLSSPISILPIMSRPKPLIFQAFSKYYYLKNGASGDEQSSYLVLNS